MIPFICAITAGVAYAVVGLLFKRAEQHKCRPDAFLLVFLCVGGITCLTIALITETTWGDGRFWALGIALGLLSYVGPRLMMAANARGPAAVTWTVVNLSLVLPILLAPLLFHEPILAVDAIAILAFVVMLVLFARSTPSVVGAPTKGIIFLLFALGAMLADGVCMLGNKLKYVWFGTGNTAGMPALSFFAAGLCAATMFRRRHPCWRLQRHEVTTGLSAGLACSVGVICLLTAMRLPVALSYPVYKGLALVGGVVLCRLVYGEDIHRLRAAAISLGLFAMLLVTLRDPITHLLGRFADGHF